MTTTKRVETEFRNVGDLVPYAKNAKKHSAAQVETLKNLIRTQGWTQPIVIDGDLDPNMIVVGHGRRLAALKIKAEGGPEQVPVRVLYGYTRPEIDALRLADNRVTSMDYDTDLMSEELQRLSAEIDMLGMGFDEKELEFANSDLGDFDTGAFCDDISAAVETQKSENADKAAEVDASAAPIADAFGFKRCTVAQSRQIRGFVKQIEDITHKTGAEAILAFFEENVA